MFNGIIYNQGIIKVIKRSPKYVKGSLVIEVSSNIKFKKSDIGESVCCDGVCLTLIRIKKKSFLFYLSKETLKRSNFKFIKIGKSINIEKSLTHGQKVSGHYVQGHVDTTGKIKSISIIDKSWNIKVSIPSKFKKYIISKGSISINGVSLTISSVIKEGFVLTIIPHTLKLTNLINLKPNNLVNLEFDIFSKYLINLNK
ncbi:MAG: riboflavin synthase [Candidatus Pelagibacter sp.]|nr:riboflavin synthase [Candidatus Pelagibacter sp.]RPG11615.1 MAG: riboflavin synthase [Pelagibacteraceae bacterium TMED170]